MDAKFELKTDSYDKILIFNNTNDSYFPHFHSNLEIVYVKEGVINTSINGQSKNLTKGCLSIANSYAIHSYKTINASKSIVLIIPLSMVSSFVKLSSNKNFASPFMDNCVQSHQILFILEKLFEIKDIDNIISVKGYLYCLLGILVDNLTLVDKFKTTNLELIRNILLYINTNYTMDLKIKDISTKFGYNNAYISSCFKSYIGCGFNHYLNSVRLNHSILLMQDKDISLTNIAFESGFNNYRTFNKAFYLTYKTTPTEYKNSHII